MFHAGIIGVMWSVAWFAVVYDTPAQHPRISEAERNFLMKALPQDDNSKGVSLQNYNPFSLNVWTA